MVCRPWLEAANNEKWTRGPCCFLQICNMPSEFLTDIKNARVRPSISFFFIPTNVSYSNMEEHIQDLLPEHSEAVMLYNSGIILDNDEREHGPGTELCFYDIIACAFLPQIPNVRIKTFKLTESSVLKQTSQYMDLINIIVNLEPPNQETSTCFILLSTYSGHYTAELLMSTMQSIEDRIASVWGGVVRSICARTDNDLHEKKARLRRETERPVCAVILITGSIQTWSVILEKKCNTKEQVEARLRLFKDQVNLKKHSIGFMFACKGRGSNMFNERNVESTIFKRLFPKVPLVGCFGNGEFGKTTIEIKKNRKGKERKHRSKSWYNEFSTTFMILTYG